MGVMCQILIHKSREGVHKSGEPVSGVVRYFIDEPTEYQDVTLSFLGKAKCRWSESSGKSSRSYRGTDRFITTHVNVTNKAPDETITLQPGSYEHPFEFYLPENIPSSYKDSIGSVTYKLKLKFVKPSFFSINKVFNSEITVYGFVKPNTASGTEVYDDSPVIFGLEKPLFAPFAVETPTVNLKAEIAKTCLTPGENAHLSYVVTNNTDVNITSVKTELYCYITYTADCGRTRNSNSRVQGCTWESPGVAEREIRKFSFSLPTLAELYSIQFTNVISREYRVRATVRLPLPHFNATVEMPVAVGERRGAADLGVEALDDLPTSSRKADAEEAASAPAASAPAPDLAPPSYWEVMHEKKTEDHK